MTPAYLHVLHTCIPYCNPLSSSTTTHLQKHNAYSMTTACQMAASEWRHNERDGVSNYRRFDCLPNRSFGCRSHKTPKLRLTDLCEGNSPVTDEFPAQKSSNAENVSILWRHHGYTGSYVWTYQKPDTHRQKKQIAFSMVLICPQPMNYISPFTQACLSNICEGKLPFAP